MTGRLSPNVQPWLADHAVSDVVLFPGTGFVELAIRAGDEVGCSVLDELTLAAPLLLPATGSVAVQVVVDAGRDSNSRGVSIFSRADAQAGWLLHAEGILRPGSVEPGADLSVWPPAGAVTVDVADGYERLATRGYRYGPAFRGLTAMWARGEEIFAEVRLPEAAGGVGGFGVHPALLDAVLHAVVIAGDPDELALPFAWQGVSLHATGASAVRARIAPAGPSAVSVELADGLGLPVLSVASMVARPVTERQLLAAVSGSGPDRLFEVIWSPASAATSPGPTPAYQIFESVAADQDPVAGSYVRSHQALAAVQSWLTDHESGVLVVATRGAMALPREDVADLAGAAVWGAGAVGADRASGPDRAGRFRCGHRRRGDRDGVGDWRAAGSAAGRTGVHRARARQPRGGCHLGAAGRWAMAVGSGQRGHLRKSAARAGSQRRRTVGARPGPGGHARHRRELPRHHDHPRHVHPRRAARRRRRGRGRRGRPRCHRILGR